MLLNGSDFQPIQLLDIRLPGQSSAAAIRITDAGHAVTWDGNYYAPLQFTRSEFTEKLASGSGEVSAVTVTVQNVDRQMAGLLGQAEVEGADATLRAADRRLLTRARDAVELTSGEVRDIQLSDTVLTFQIVNVLGMLERLTVPRRIYQAHCNYTFGAIPSCGVDISAAPTTLHAAAQTGTTAQCVVLPLSILTDAGDPDDPGDFWANGYVAMKAGAAGLQSRPIQRVEVTGTAVKLWLRFGFLVAPAVGDGLIVRRQCNKTKSLMGGCQEFQGNALQYGGFEEVPPVRFKPTEHDLH